MKSTTIMFALASVMFFHANGQIGVGTTYYGNNAGQYGNYNSHFGSSAAFDNYGDNNVAVGASAFPTGGAECTAVGRSAMNGGHFCTGIGYQALRNNRRIYVDGETPDGGYYNTGVGYRTSEGNRFGDYNTAIGAESLLSNKTDYNVAIGYRALYGNDDGSSNTAAGVFTLYSNSSGYQNTALGNRSLYSNSTGYRNTAVGNYALNFNLSGANNTAAGSYALYNNNMGNLNTGLGYRALNANTTGNYNTAHGAYALDENFGGDFNTAIGYNSGPIVDLLSNTTALGHMAVPTASNQVRLGNTSITSIGGQVNWTAFSDGRFKKDVREDVSGLEFISQLRPVSYTVDKVGLNKFLNVSDSSSNLAQAKYVPERQTGFVAQEVESIVKKTGFVFSGVDAPENESDPYGLRYSEFVVPLVKGMQELLAIIKEHEQKDEEQQKQIDSLLGQLDSRRQDELIRNNAAVLLQNNPNPFDAETEINMTLPDNVGYASVTIYNLEGKQLKNIQITERGDVKTKTSANELAPGMYLYSLIADGKVVDTKRMVLTR